MPPDPPESHGAPSETTPAPDTPPMVILAVSRYAPCRWVQGPIAALASWLVASPFMLGYSSRALVWNDVLSGLSALVLSALALSTRRGPLSWLIAFVGFWLLLAPLAFRAPSPAADANDTLVGAFLVGLGLIVPMAMKMQGAAIPKGWSYNPSSWPQRAPVIALAFVSFLVARYLAAFQLGHIPSMRDPLFGGATERVLMSSHSRAGPVSVASLGAIAYLLVALMGSIGDSRRWRTMPWLVAGYGFVVLALGIVSVVLVILQPLAVGAWCSLCLFTAAAALVMIPMVLDEVVAVFQLLIQVTRQQQSAWRVFWLGANIPEDALTWAWLRPRSWSPRAMTWGVSVSATLLISVAVGLWLLVSPAVFGVDMGGAAADSDHLVGVLIVAVAVISLADVARPGRFLLLPLGLWLLVAPWFLPGGTLLSRSNGAVLGVLLTVLSLPRGAIRDHYGSYDAIARWSPGARSRRPERRASQRIGAPAVR